MTRLDTGGFTLALHGKLGEFMSGKEDRRARAPDPVFYSQCAAKRSSSAPTYRLMKDVLSPTPPSKVEFAAMVTTMGAHFALESHAMIPLQ